MKMAAGLDSGPILMQEQLEIGPEETTPELSERLSVAGAALLVRTLEQLATGQAVESEQDEAAASLAPKLRREDGEVDWLLTARQIFDRWRAYTPWPGLTARLGGDPVKLRRCRVSEETAGEVEPGTVLTAGPQLRVDCGSGTSLVLEALQRPNRGVLQAEEFVNGERLTIGDRFERAMPA